MPRGIAHFLFYQHNVQQFFLRHRAAYDGVLVPLSIATSFQAGTYGFLRALFAEDQDKVYAIDPRTALFQKDWDRSKIREPHKRMANALGDPVLNHGLRHALTADRLQSEEAVRRFTDTCLTYQVNFRVQPEHERKLGKYKKLAGLSDLPQIRNPPILIPPYFQFSSAADPWHAVNMRCIESAMSAGYSEEIRPVVHFEPQALRALDWPSMAAQLQRLGVRSVFIYPNNLREHDATEEQLIGYRNAIRSLSAAGITPHAFHGGYFAILLSLRGLGGFGNGIGYGEWRNSGYHAGGTAEVRVYVPRLHRFLSPQEAQQALGQVPELSERSPLLAECVEEGRLLATLTQEETLDDFMAVRTAEIGLVKGPAGSELAFRELEETLKLLDRVGQLERERYGLSLKRWLGCLQA